MYLTQYILPSRVHESHVFLRLFLFYSRATPDLLPSLLLVLVDPGVESETGVANNVLSVRFQSLHSTLPFSSYLRQVPTFDPMTDVEAKQMEVEASVPGGKLSTAARAGALRWTGHQPPPMCCSLECTGLSNDFRFPA